MRRKIAYLSKMLLFELVRQRQQNIVLVPVFDGIPEDVTLVDVFYDVTRDCFGFKLEHDSFEDVAVGLAYPEVNISYQTTMK